MGLATVVANYTGRFTNFALGKQVGQDLLVKGSDVIFAAAGVDGLGAIQAVKGARDEGKPVYVIGVDSDPSHLAPKAVLSAVVKRVDLVWCTRPFETRCRAASRAATNPWA